MVKRKNISLDLEVDYINSRSVTQKELDDISAYIRNQKIKTTFPIFAKRPSYRKKKEYV